MLDSWIQHPLARGLDLDAPDTTHRRRQIIRQKPFLRDIYTDWYAGIAAALPKGPGRVLELGSGAGFLNEFVSDLLSSDIMLCPGIRLVLDGANLPFADRTLKAIVMTNVLHHLPRPRQFLLDAARCVRAGGVIIMAEPWVSAWSRLIYTHFHHEPFRPEASAWEFCWTGPLSGANGALPWILFERDREIFEREFRCWAIESLVPFMPFRYLVSGGVALRQFAPSWSSRFWRRLQAGIGAWAPRLAMFAKIVLRRAELY